MRGSALDLVGLVLLCCCAGWALVTAAGRDARPEGVVLAVLGVAAGYACGRIAGSLLPVAGPAAAALAGAALAVAREGDARAAVFALAVGAACCAAWGARTRAVRVVLAVSAIAIAAAAWVAGCVAASAVLLWSLVAARTRHRLLGLTALALGALVVAGGVWAVAEHVLPLADARAPLWREAASLAHRHPLLGVGPGNLDEASGAVPRSGVLRQAAEEGVPGVLLLGAAYVWVLCSLGRSPLSTSAVLSAGGALTAVAALASVGSALSFAPVTSGAGVLVGLATAHPPVTAGPLGWGGDDGAYGSAPSARLTDRTS